MRAIVFSGPSLPPSAIPPVPGLEWRPPVRHGDVARAALERPDAIGIIDGYFETTPTVWHKEILFALAQGIKVYGAASIGALRAAELDSFGMIGIGRIYEWYRDGVIEDDDEVAVLHGPAEVDFVPLTVAMVDVRAAVQMAYQQQLTEQKALMALLSIAKLCHYKKRTWERLLLPSKRQSPPLGSAHWQNRVIEHSQKRADSAEMISELANKN